LLCDDGFEVYDIGCLLHGDKWQKIMGNLGFFDIVNKTVRNDYVINYEWLEYQIGLETFWGSKLDWIISEMYQ